jgi:hypothetical protein
MLTSIDVLEHFAFILKPITKLMQKFEVFNWTTNFQIVWETIKSQFIDPLDWDFKFHVHINVSNLAVGLKLVALNIISFLWSLRLFM